MGNNAVAGINTRLQPGGAGVPAVNRLNGLPARKKPLKRF
jgi:hypothetical protein